MKRMKPFQNLIDPYYICEQFSVVHNLKIALKKANISQHTS